MNPSLGLLVADLNGPVPPALLRAAEQAVAHGPCNLPSRKVRGTWRAVWGEVFRRYLRRVAPQAWVYRGGCHVAVHERQPTRENPDAGRCYLRLIEVPVVLRKGGRHG